MERGLGAFQLIQHLLVEFLTWTQSRKLNLYVLGPRQVNHTLGQVSNLHRFTHVEDENLTAMALGTSLQHQFTSLWYQHEESDDIRMSHGQRTSILNLFTEQRNHRTIRTQHITESRGHKLGLYLLVQRLHIDLTDTLRTAHHIGGVHSLVGRDHDKFLHPVFHGHIGNHLCAIDIVQNSLRGVVLHHRNVLIGSSMENVVRPVHAEYGIHSGLAVYRGDDGLSLHIRKLLGHHQSDVMLRCLCLVYQDHLGRTV